MFKLISQKDKNVISNRAFVKNAEFLQDLTAFYDAFSNICDTKLDELPEFCKLDEETLSLDGSCLFIKMYSSEFGFASLDLSLSYLKILYYSIAALSEEGIDVSRDVLINEYLVYKQANEKYYGVARQKLNEFKTEKNIAVEKFANKNNSQAKCFIWSRVTDILATISIILAVFLAVMPFAFYYAEKIALKSTIIYAVASILIGIILRFEFKMISRYIAERGTEKAYELQTLKKDKDLKLDNYEKFLLASEEIIVQNYEFKKDFNSVVDFKKLSFAEILKRAVNLDEKTEEIKDDIQKFDQNLQEQIYDIVDKIASAKVEEIGRLENTYEEIKSKDYLWFNNYIRHSFLSRAVDNYISDKKWSLKLKSDKDPFDVNIKALASDEICINKKGKQLKMPYSSFKHSKYKKLEKVPRLKRINSEENLIDAEYKYLLHYNILSSSKDNMPKRLVKPLELKLKLVRNRIFMAGLSENNYLKAKRAVCEYENQQIKTLRPELSEKQQQREIVEKEYIRSIFECDELKLINNEEVLCIVGGRQYHGFRLSKI